MLKVAYTEGSRDAMVKLALTPPDWKGMPLSDFSTTIDPMLQELHTRANRLEARGSLMSAKKLLRKRLQLEELARELQRGGQFHAARNLEDFNQQFAARGLAPEAPTEASLLNRLSRGRFGRPANKPAPTHRAEDIRAALNRVRGLTPENMPELMDAYGKGGKKGFRRANKLMRSGGASPSPKGGGGGGGGGGGMGGLARMGLGAAALAGGGMLLNNLLTDDSPPTDPAYANFR